MVFFDYSELYTALQVTNYALTAQSVPGNRYILNFRVARFSFVACIPLKMSRDLDNALQTSVQCSIVVPSPRSDSSCATA